MDFRTTVKVEPSSIKISYKSPVMFIGSCFASSIGEKLASGKMPVMINPAGTVYNPFSVSNTLDSILSQKSVTPEDLNFHEGLYLSFNHYTDFSSEDPDSLIVKINENTAKAFSFMQRSGFLFITFGTARVYRLKETGKIVSNCHKVPESKFESQLLSVNEIIDLWNKQLDRIHTLFPNIKVIFTISPVRHWKDGAHGNQLSKSVLFLAVEELLKHPVAPQYFPAYEILMDDLRDYRFYADDMLHPSNAAIEYIWNQFSECYIENKSIKIWNEVVKISKAFNHRITSGNKTAILKFAGQMLLKIDDICKVDPDISFETERFYFEDLKRI
jgi:hypothetical protein